MNTDGLTFKELVNATFTPHAQALGALTGSGTNTEGFSLPAQDLGDIAERMNMDNPLEFYYSDLKVDASGSGSVQIEYEIFNDVWTRKNGWFTETGNGGEGWGYQGEADGTISKKGIDMSKIREIKETHKEVFYWNDSQIKGGGIFGADKARGLPSTYLQRNQRALRKFSQTSVKEGFKHVIAPKENFIAFSPISIPKAGFGKNAWEYKTKKINVPTAYLPYEVYVPKASGAGVTLQEQGAVLYKTLVDAATRHYLKTERDPSELLITIDPIHFNLLAMTTLLGDKVTKTFSGGQFQVSTISEFRIQSGGIYLPKTATLAAEHKEGKYINSSNAAITGTEVTGVPVVAFIGTSDAMLHQKDVIAMNAGRIGNTSDFETYTEMTDITAVPDRTFREGLIKLIVTEKGTIAPYTPSDAVEVVDTETVNIELDDEDSK